MIRLISVLILIVVLHTIFNLSYINSILLLLGIILLLKVYNDLEKIKINKNKNETKTNNKTNTFHNLDVNDNTNNNKWTSDHIIPNNVYNPKDCTNDGSCIIPPDKYNLAPKNNGKYSDIIGTRFNMKYKHSNIDSDKYCMICLKNINPIQNIVTENFVGEDPYSSFPNNIDNNIENNINIINKLQKILNNIENDKCHSNLSIKDINKISKKLCRHCKVGLCINDGCISV